MNIVPGVTEDQITDAPTEILNTSRRMSSIVPEAPPSYQVATSSGNHLKPNPRNGIPPLSRRSMEDENRELPSGWIRQYDSVQHHQFFVDTNADPPRSIWHHPYDDEQFMSGLPSTERERVQALHRTPTAKDLEAESTDEEVGRHHESLKSAKQSKIHLNDEATTSPSLHSTAGSLGAGGTITAKPETKESFGRRVKDKLTGSTHEEREARRVQRAKEEQQAYEAHLAFRRAMSQAAETGQPVLLGKDREGHDVYVEPPQFGYGGGYGTGGYGYGPGARSYNPYSQGPYANPNARFIAPPQPYGRPYGGGYGGGYGLPLLGGLTGGLLLGGLMF